MPAPALSFDEIRRRLVAVYPGPRKGAFGSGGCAGEWTYAAGGHYLLAIRGEVSIWPPDETALAAAVRGKCAAWLRDWPLPEVSAAHAELARWANPDPCPVCHQARRYRCSACLGVGLTSVSCSKCSNTHSCTCGTCDGTGETECRTCVSTQPRPGWLLGVLVDRAMLSRVLALLPHSGVPVQLAARNLGPGDRRLYLETDLGRSMLMAIEPDLAIEDRQHPTFPKLEVPEQEVAP